MLIKNVRCLSEFVSFKLVQAQHKTTRTHFRFHDEFKRALDTCRSKLNALKSKAAKCNNESTWNWLFTVKLEWWYTTYIIALVISWQNNELIFKWNAFSVLCLLGKMIMKWKQNRRKVTLEKLPNRETTKSVASQYFWIFFM